MGHSISRLSAPPLGIQGAQIVADIRSFFYGGGTADIPNDDIADQITDLIVCSVADTHHMGAGIRAIMNDPTLKARYDQLVFEISRPFEYHDAIQLLPAASNLRNYRSRYRTGVGPSVGMRTI